MNIVLEMRVDLVEIMDLEEVIKNIWKILRMSITMMISHERSR